ncbi:serine hydrolase domain-containing protein [Mycobacterium sp. pV006]|uniref:serine hydrolase domain-containing protein n=1 Tax=Mycobacterium sp. pV006 TaxID=3238983 RepID=UPI00351AF657
MRLVVTASAVALFALMTPAASAVPPAIDQALTREVTAADLPGGAAVVRAGTALTRYAAGYADVDTRSAFGPDTHIRAASITKPFVAATLLQLVAEGRLDLDAPIERYLPARIRGDGFTGENVTVRQLLRHQSGLPEYADPTTPVPTGPVTADQLLERALARPAQFSAGTALAYTNTNYVIAGLLIEAVTGSPAADEITRRIIDPLGLRNTYFPAPGDTGLRSPFARGYELVDRERTDVTAFNASAAGMSGALVSTNEDMSAFITALLDGHVVPPTQLREMMDTVPQSPSDPSMRYGLGLASIALSCGVTVWGHGGDLPGYHSLVVKPVSGPALSITVTQEAASKPTLETPVMRVADALYCPAG